MNAFRMALLVAAAASLSGYVYAYEPCGVLTNAYGPFDYRTDTQKLQVVEAFHFTPEVETLTRGKSSSIAGDLDYTLRASPNHSRALIAMMNLSIREKKPKFAEAAWSIACYFDRALRFRPDDGMVRLVYATFLSKSGKPAEAVKQLEAAAASGMNSGNFNYNLGLAYFEFKDYEKSLAAAHKAYQLGFNLPGLKGKLVSAGKWREPPPMAQVAAKPDVNEADKPGPDDNKPEAPK